MQLNRETMRKLILLITFTAVLIWGLFHPSAILGIGQAVFRILAPFILGFCIAFVINLLIRPIENGWDALWKNRRGRWKHTLKRPVSIVLSLALIAAAIFVLLFMILPELVRTTSLIIEMTPGFVARVETWWGQLSETLGTYGITVPQLKLDGAELVARASEWLSEGGLALFGRTTIDITTSIFSWIFNIGLGLIFSLYVLAQKEQLGRQSRNILHAMLPTEKADRIIEISNLTGTIFAKFVTGQLMESVIIGILCFLGMLALSMPYAPMISVLVGATALIPVFGALFGTAIGAILILMVDPMKSLWFIIFIIVLQQFEGNVIYPRMMGKSVGLPGIWVLTAVTIGGSTLGVLGMLLGVPVCSVLYALTRTTVNRRLAEK